MTKHISLCAALSAATFLVPCSYAADGMYTEELTVTQGSDFTDVVQGMAEGDDKLVRLGNDVDINSSITQKKGVLTIEGGSLRGAGNTSETGIINNVGTELIIKDTEISGMYKKGLEAKGSLKLENVYMHDNVNDTFPGISGTVNITTDYNNNVGKAEIIDGRFENNVSLNQAGVISNKGDVGKISGTFSGNKISSSSYNGQGGSAIYNYGKKATVDGETVIYGGKIDEINAEFNNNLAETTSSNSISGTIYNDTNGSIKKIVSDFRDNRVVHKGSALISSFGGAISNGGTIEEISGTVDENGVRTRGTFSGNKSGFSSDDDLKNESAEAGGGAIYNKGTIGTIKDVEFLNNTSMAENDAFGGAILNTKNIGRIENVVFEGNQSVSMQDGAHGGALSIGTSTTAGSSATATVGEIVNTKFINNTAEVKDGSKKVYGGAIYALTPTLNLKADGGETVISGNKTIQGGIVVNNGIYLNSTAADAGINMDARNGGKVIIDDEIDGYKKFSAPVHTINITGDESGEVQLNNAVKNAKEITLTGTTLTLGTKETMAAGKNNPLTDQTSLTLNSGVLNLENDHIQTVEVDNFSSSENVSLRVDANLADGSSDRIVAQTVDADAKIKLGNINVTEDGDSDIQLIKSADGNAPEFVNLNDYASYTADYKYTFENKGSGVLGISEKKELQQKGLNAAVSDTNTTERHYQVSATETNVTGDLGALQGGAGTELFVEGNGLSLNGDNHAGMIVADGQKAHFVNVNEVSGFNSENGGVVNNSGTLNIVNSSFVGNTAQKGGAVYNSGNANIEANGADVVFKNNAATDLGKNNAVYMAGDAAVLNLKANDGTIHFEDGITGDQGYSINVSGADSENSGVVFADKLENLNKLNINSSNVKLADEGVINNASLNLNGGHLDLSNGKIGQVNLADYTGNNGLLSLDVNPAGAEADQLVINGNASGHTRLYVKAMDQGKAADDILFATVKGDVNNATFDVWRVAGSPYMWETSYNPDSQQWFLNTPGSLLDPGMPGIPSTPLTPEMAYYLGLTSAGFEINRDLLRNVQDKSSAGIISYGCCGFYDENYNGKNLYNVWVSPVYRSVKVRDEADYDADISGAEFGFDVVSDSRNRSGVFLSYRQGDFDFSGRGDKFVSAYGSDMDIDSYVIGLYHAYTYGRSWLWSGIYGGYQNVNMKTKDGVRAKTDGYQAGGRLAAGYNWNITPSFLISPIAALSYNWLHYDDIKDNAGKSVEYEDLSSLDAELGVRLEKTIATNTGYAKLYVQPGVVQYFGFNNKVRVSNFTPIKTPKNQTLGRMQLGGRISIRNKYMFYGNLEHTFGQGYKDTSVKVGMNYAF